MLADKIRARRKVLDISQQQLARISGIAQSSIYKKKDQVLFQEDGYTYNQ